MHVLWITGLPGAGKSSLAPRLMAHFPAQDADLDGFSHRRYINSRQPVPAGEPFDRSVQEWALDLDVVRVWRARPEPLGLLLGAVSNEFEAREAGLFDGVVFIDVPVEELVRRVRARPEGEYGHRPGEIDQLVELAATYRHSYESAGVTIVCNDDGQDCLDDILRIAHALVPSCDADPD